MALASIKQQSACFSLSSQRSRRPAALVGSTARTRRHSSTALRASSVDSSSNTSTATVDARTATVQVDLGHAAEQCSVQLTHPSSKLVEATMQFPLGLVLENVDGQVVVTEVAEGSAADAAGCCLGDVLRATTAFTMQMTYPTMNLMFGGGGRPRLMKMLVPSDKVPFSKVMDAVRSNTRDQGGDGTVTLVLERIEASSSSSSSSSDGVQQHAPKEVAVLAETVEGQEGGPMFDPRIFNSTFE